MKTQIDYRGLYSNSGWCSKLSDPSEDESMSNSLGSDVGNRCGFYPTSETINACEDVGKTLDGGVDFNVCT